jgi:hypothetical protein
MGKKAGVRLTEKIKRAHIDIPTNTTRKDSGGGKRKIRGSILLVVVTRVYDLSRSKYGLVLECSLPNPGQSVLVTKPPTTDLKKNNKKTKKKQGRKRFHIFNNAPGTTKIPLPFQRQCRQKKRGTTSTEPSIG